MHDGLPELLMSGWSCDPQILQRIGKNWGQHQAEATIPAQEIAGGLDIRRINEDAAGSIVEEDVVTKCDVAVARYTDEYVVAHQVIERCRVTLRDGQTVRLQAAVCDHLSDCGLETQIGTAAERRDTMLPVERKQFDLEAHAAEYIRRDAVADQVGQQARVERHASKVAQPTARAIESGCDRGRPVLS